MADPSQEPISRTTMKDLPSDAADPQLEPLSEEEAEAVQGGIMSRGAGAEATREYTGITTWNG
jgi:hypothetical protein